MRKNLMLAIGNCQWWAPNIIAPNLTYADGLQLEMCPNAV